MPTRPPRHGAEGLSAEAFSLVALLSVVIEELLIGYILTYKVAPFFLCEIASQLFFGPLGNQFDGEQDLGNLSLLIANPNIVLRWVEIKTVNPAIHVYERHRFDLVTVGNPEIYFPVVTGGIHAEAIQL